MKFLKYSPGPIHYWIAGALTEFVNGCIAGIGGGSLVGVGTGAVTVGTTVGSGMSSLNQLYLAASSFVLTMLGNGVKRVVVWHNSNPFPNPWPKPDNATDNKPQ